MEYHIPVMKEESLGYLITSKDGTFFDGTIGGGGHSEEILNRISDKGILVATDKDKSAFDFCGDKFKSESRLKLYHTGYHNIDTVSRIEFIDSYDGIFADLGVSSYQLDDKESGFTFREDAPLDLRMDKSSGVPASHVINTFEENELADIFFKYGEEKLSRRIAKKISVERANVQIVTTLQLRKIIEGVIPSRHVTKTLARIFQALRIFVNNELEDLRVFLKKSTELLKPGGTIVILTYHSLEDRIVKEHFKYENLECICPKELPVCNCDKERRLEIITRKPLTPGEEELKENPRSRSAKLRVAKRV